MTKREILADYFSDEGDSILFLDEYYFDDALIGSIEVEGKNVAVYSERKCINILMQYNNWDLETAIKYYELNVVGAHFKYAPRFINDEMFDYD